MNKILYLGFALVALLVVAGCSSSAERSNYEYVPAYGGGCGVEGPAPTQKTSEQGYVYEYTLKEYKTVSVSAA